MWDMNKDATGRIWMNRLCIILLILFSNGCLRWGFNYDNHEEKTTIGDLSLIDSTKGPFSLKADGSLDSTLIIGNDAQQKANWTEFSFQSFIGVWQLPNTLAWGWKCSNVPSTFDHFELCVAEDIQTLNSPAAQCYKEIIDQKFGTIICPAQGFHLGISYELFPDRQYVARVRAYNKLGDFAEAGPVSQRTTQEPVTKKELFHDSLLSGASLDGFTVSTTNPAKGTGCLVATIDNDNWITLRLKDLNLSYSGLTEERFKSGYVELYLELENPRTVIALFDGKNDYARYAPPKGYICGDDQPGYQRIQFPLSDIVWYSTTIDLTFATLQEITGISLGAYFGPGKVLVDEISIWY